MGFIRRVHNRILLLLLGHIATAVALPRVHKETDLNLDCTNDFEDLISCQLEQQNCPEYSLTLQSNTWPDLEKCTLEQCGNGRCCCSVKMMLLDGDSHTAAVWKGGQRIESKTFSVKDSMKPKTPTLVSVEESNGNFEVMWETNMKGFVVESLSAEVTYYKKGDTEKVSERVQQTEVNGLSYYKINGQHLEPSTTYVVRVRSITGWSGKISDSSNEKEFETPASSDSPLLPIIISFSIAAVILSGAVFLCYVKLKTKWWDRVAKYPNPKLLMMHPSEEEVLKPVPPIISSVCVDPLIPDDIKLWSKGSLTDSSSGSVQQSSGISTGSSGLSYANTEPAKVIAGVQDALCKAFPNISPISPLITSPLTELNKDSSLFSAPHNPCAGRVDGMSSGSSGFDNKTYSILIPSCPHQIMADSSEVEVRADANHPSERDTVSSHHQQVPACPVPAWLDVILPPAVSSLVATDMSYQQCKADSGRFSYADDASLSSTSSGTDTTTPCELVSRVEAGCEGSDEAVSGAAKLNGKSEEAIICDENPFYGCTPAGSHSFPSVDEGYQAFQNLVGQPDVLLSEQRSGEHEEHLDKHQEESFIKIPQNVLSPAVPGFINHSQSGQTPFLSVLSVEQSMPVITDSGYQCV